MEVQTRNEKGATIQHPTIAEAFHHAKNVDQSVWKISWTNAETNERVRLVTYRVGDTMGWVYEPLVLGERLLGLD
jgi:hypothetical protein